MPLPLSLHRAWNGWKAVGRGIGIAVSFVLLSVVWLVVFGIYALCMKCFRWVGRSAPSSSWQAVLPDYQHSFDHGF